MRYKLKPGVKTVEVMSSLCHPLCQCEKCQKVEDILLETNGTDTLKVRFFFCFFLKKRFICSF